MKDLHTYNELLACDVTFDSQRFITGGEDATIRVYSLTEKKMINCCIKSAIEAYVDGHSMKICFLRYHPRGEKLEEYSHIFISGGWDRTVQIWHDRFQHSLWVIHGPYLPCIDALDIDGEFNHILTASYERNKYILQVWRFPEDIIFDLQKCPEYKYFGTTHEPLVEIFDSTQPEKVQGFLAKWIGSSHMLFAGRDASKVIALDKSNLNTEGSLEDLPSGVVSACVLGYCSGILPQPVPVLSIASGNKIIHAQLKID
ncbi:hypothetical protein Ciccas_000263 [Cichlidogyrus casuarinus]|uniref:Uncharacterized protein n=1 Tax=Cichlidogyrus casuarinus TaxID=1844966 RepID=A0ABD2QNG8_9PLAT